MARSLTRHWRWLTGMTVLTLAAGFALPFAVKAPDLQEKRELAQFPALPTRPSDLAKFRKGVDAYVGDHFPARPHLIGGLNGLRLPLQVSGSDRVIVGRDGWLFYDDGTHLGAARNDPQMPAPDVRIWLEHLAGRSEALAKQGVPYLIVAAPQKETIYPQMGPAWYAGPDPDRPALLLSRWAAQSGAGQVLYPHDAIARATGWGMKTYSRNDTHWTGLGAYEAYAAIIGRLQAMGFKEAARPLTDFRELPAEPFDSRDLALMLGVASFVKVDFPQFEDPKVSGTLNIVYLSDNRDWTGPRVIDTGQAGKPVLLITVDSFSNALLPFLYSHFSRLIVAHNQDGSWREDLIARFKPDLVMLEVVESGLPASLNPAPPASADAVARIAKVSAGPRVTPKSKPAKPVTSSSWRATNAPDDLHGREANDTINGLDGDDTIRGGRGGDLLHGGRGNDWMSGDRGDDTLWGDEGADTFHSFSAAGIDKIMDFSIAEGDWVLLDAGSTFTVVQKGPDAVIEMAGGAQVILVGVQAASLKPGSVVVSH